MPTIERIRSHWHRLMPYIESLIAETQHDDLMPEDIFHWCESGKATLVMAPEGFVIISVETDAVTDAKELLIWFAHAYKLGDDCVTRYLPYFKDLAKELGCRYISTKTAFDPVGKHLVDRGWERGQTEYRLPVA